MITKPAPALVLFAAIVGFSVACGGDSNQIAEPTRVPATDVLTPAVTTRLEESGAVILDTTPDIEPRVPLSEVAKDFAEYDLRAERAGLMIVDWFPQIEQFQPDAYSMRLVWIVSVDTTESTEEDLFPRDATEAVALVDALDGTLQTVYTR